MLTIDRPQTAALYAPDLSSRPAPELSAAPGWVPDWVPNPDSTDAYAPTVDPDSVFAMFDAPAHAASRFAVDTYAPELAQGNGWVPEWATNPYAGSEPITVTPAGRPAPRPHRQARVTRSFGRIGHTLAR